MFFQKLIEQHRVHRIITYRIDLAVLVAHDEIRIHSGHFLGNQSKLRRAGVVALIMKRHGFECQNGFADFVHCLNVGLITPRRTRCAELACRVDYHSYRVSVLRCDVANVGDKTAVVYVRTSTTDTDNVGSRGNEHAGIIAQGRVGAASGVTRQRATTDGRVEVAGSVTRQRVNAIGGVVATGGVALECVRTLSKRAITPLAVLSSPAVLFKRAPAPVAVLLSAVLARSVPAPMAVLKLPTIMLSSEKKPTAVLYVPVVRLRRAFWPSAVLPPG